MIRLRSRATDSGLPLGLRVLTISELENFGSTQNRERAKKRIRCDARRGKRSKAARYAGSCAVFGALAAGANLLGEIVANQQFEDRGAVKKDFIGGCVAGIAAPGVIGWVKGFWFEAR